MLEKVVFMKQLGTNSPFVLSHKCSDFAIKKKKMTYASFIGVTVSTICSLMMLAEVRS